MAEADSFRNPEKKNGRPSGQAPGLNSGPAAWWQPAMMMFLKLSAWIAGPVIIALFLGKWLDNRYDSAPWLFLVCTLVAFLISMVGLIKHALIEYRKIEKTSKVKNKTKDEKKFNSQINK